MRVADSIRGDTRGHRWRQRALGSRYVGRHWSSNSRKGDHNGMRGGTGLCGISTSQKRTWGYALWPSHPSAQQYDTLAIKDHAIDLSDARNQSKIRVGMRWDGQDVRQERQVRLCFACDRSRKYESPHTATATRSAH